MYNEFDAFGELFSQYNTYANKTSCKWSEASFTLKICFRTVLRDTKSYSMI